MYLLGVRGSTTFSYIVCDYTTSGHMDLQCMHVVYIQYAYISIQYIYVFILVMQ